MSKKLIKPYIEIKMIKKSFVVFLFLQIFLMSKAITFENKILIKVDNEIITSIDILNESNYLKAMNENLQDLDKNQLWKISLKSLTKDKIKKIELLNNIEKIELDLDNSNQIITSIYKRFGYESLRDFKDHLILFNVNYKFFEEKVAIETLWNELIYARFHNKIFIDKDRLKKEIEKNNKKKIKTFLLSEIVFDTSDKVPIEEKYELIKKEIDQSDFQKAALTYSISNSSSSGGDLGWVNENMINIKLKNEISNLEIGELSKPIIIPGGALILRIEDMKEIENKINLKEKLDELVRYSTNEQLNQFSNIYFNKIKKNIKINEL